MISRWNKPILFALMKLKCCINSANVSRFYATFCNFMDDPASAFYLGRRCSEDQLFMRYLCLECPITVVSWVSLKTCIGGSLEIGIDGFSHLFARRLTSISRRAGRF